MKTSWKKSSGCLHSEKIVRFQNGSGLGKFTTVFSINLVGAMAVSESRPLEERGPNVVLFSERKTLKHISRNYSSAA